MKLLTTVIAAASGAAAGYAVHQLHEQQGRSDGVHDLVIAVPAVNAAAGALVGLITRSPSAAFATSLGITAVAGTQFEDLIDSLVG